MIYYTQEYNEEYCDDPGIKLLGKLRIDLPDSRWPVLFGLASKNKRI